MNGLAWRSASAAIALLLGTLAAGAAGAIQSAQSVAQNTQPGRAPAPRGPAAAPAAPAAPSGPAANPAQAPAAPAQPHPEAAAPIPTRTEILNFENWVVTCNEFAEGPRTRVCSALLQILQQTTKQIVFTWTIAVDDSKQLVTIMQTLPGVAIPPGVELRVGKSPPRKVPYASCETGRCVATMTMDASLLRELAASPTAEAVIQGSQGNTVQFNIQMKGFDRAYAILSRP
jgi:invasion protein IalB